LTTSITCEFEDFDFCGYKTTYIDALAGSSLHETS
jgi:hypothetical protein